MMDLEAMLKARGWVQHGAGLDLWRQASGGEWHEGRAAWTAQRDDDLATVEVLGSVTYHPTAEQAQTSPLLGACAARGMVERDVIRLLFEEGANLRKIALEFASKAPTPPAIHIAADEGVKLMAAEVNRARAIAEAWKALAIARQVRTWFGAGDDPQARAAVVELTRAVAALRALGIDPDAVTP